MDVILTPVGFILGMCAFDIAQGRDFVLDGYAWDEARSPSHGLNIEPEARVEPPVYRSDDISSA